MRLFFGLLLILIGLLILGNNVDWFDLDLGDLVRDYWPVILIVIGVEEIVRHWRRRPWAHVEWTEFAGGEFSKSFGDVHLKPVTMDAGGLKASQGAGDITIDLTGTTLNLGENRIECSLGMGNVKVLLPAGVPLAATCTAGVGTVHVLGKQSDGFGAKVEHQDADYANADKKIRFAGKVGLGDVKITHA